MDRKSAIINNRARASQLLAFDGMQYGKCRPTDVDLSIDFQGNMFIFAELKGRGVPLTVGQKIHLTGLVDAIEAGGKQALAIVAHHDTPNTEHDVHCAEATVHSMYQDGSWERVLVKKTLDELIKEVHAGYQFGRGK